jgi:hypothetical protein
MNNFYHKVAFASVCTALSFALGANKEAKAATFSLPSTITFEAVDAPGLPNDSFDGRGDRIYSKIANIGVARGTLGESALLTEFNIGSFPFAPNTVINSAVLQVEIFSLTLFGLGVDNIIPGSLGIFGYIGNGTAEASDFEAGVFLNSVNISSPSVGDILSFDVSPYINQRVSNGDAFAGFGIRALNLGGLFLSDDNNNNSRIKPRLIVETANVTEPVPEPSTILTAAIAVGWGGWLKRKNSSQQDKTKSQG